MSDRMHPIPFEALLDWVLGEYLTQTFNPVYKVDTVVAFTNKRIFNCCCNHILTAF